MGGIALLVALATLASDPAQDGPAASATVRTLPGTRGWSRYDDVFRKYSKRYFGVGFDWRLFKAQGIAESGLDPDARSWVGARGIMQLMPSTFTEIATRNPEIARIDDPEWNIAAGIFYDRTLWRLWEQDSIDTHRREFMLASYNAGRATIRKAQAVARLEALDHRSWPSIARVAPKVERWRFSETLTYVQRIDSLHALLARERTVRSIFARR